MVPIISIDDITIGAEAIVDIYEHAANKDLLCPTP